MVGGGVFSNRAVVFSDDGKLLLVPVSNQVRLYSTATGERVGELSGHKADVTVVCINPSNAGQVYSGSLDKTIQLWDYRAQCCLRVYDVKECIESLVVSKEYNVAYLAIHWREYSAGRVLAYQLDAGKAGTTAMKTRSPAPLLLSPAGNFVATTDRHSLFVWRAGSEIRQPVNLHHTKPYTCVAISNNEHVLAAGDVSGRILIWHDFDSLVPNDKGGAHPSKRRPEAPPPLTTLHWHAHAVGCITFSADSTLMLSGGAEGVLVMWQVADHSRRYLPRLGGPLAGLTCHPNDPAMYCVRHSDNMLRVVNTATMKVDSSVVGIRPMPVGFSAAAVARAAALQPVTGHLFLAADNAELQVYDVVHDRHVALVQVVPRNPISAPEREERSGGLPQPPPPCTTHVAFSPQEGGCMVTVDVRPSPGPRGSCGSAWCLRFWDAASGRVVSGQSYEPYTLNTRVDNPHRAAVSDLVHHPTLPLVVTTGGDEFRLWGRRALTRRPGSRPAAQTCWVCRARGGYKGLPCNAAAFSDDGSMMAVATGSQVTLWDPERCALVRVLSCPIGMQTNPIMHLAFVHESPYLVGGSSSCLVVWDLLSLAPAWAYQVHVIALASDPHHAYFAAAVSAPPTTTTAPLTITHLPKPTPTATTNTPSTNAAAVDQPTPSHPPLDDDGPPSSVPVHPLPARPVNRSAMTHIFVFEPPSSKPRYHTALDSTDFAQVMFTHRSMAAYGPAALLGPPSFSPLLILRSDRSFSFAMSPDRVLELQERKNVMQPVRLESEEFVSMFQAAFGGEAGEVGMGREAGMGVEVADALMVEEDRETREKVATSKKGLALLLDAPSHMLPPPTQLAVSFLQIMCQEGDDV